MNTSSSNKKKNRKNKIVAVREVVPRSVRPPKFDPNMPVRRRMRFYFNATPSAISPVTAANVLEAFGAVCTVVNSGAVPLFGWVRIRSIEVWGQPFQAGQVGQSNVAVVWGYQNSMNAPLFGTNREVQDTSTSPTYVPYIKAVPPKESNASLWQARLDSAGGRRTGSANILFSVLAQQNSVLDMEVDLVAYDAGHTVATTPFTITSGALGAYAYAALDGPGGQIAPQGVDQFV